MARILIEDEWFEQVLPSTLSESELEQKIVIHAPSVYPDYFVIPFKKTIESPHDNARPDLAFISKDYRDWFVVEIEMGYHPFASHVEPQVRNLSTGFYNKDVIEYLCTKEPLLDFDRTYELIRTNPVKILIIVNEPMSGWSETLAKYNALITVFELFKSDTNREIFRVDGEYPAAIVASVSDCFFHPYLRILGVKNPDALQLAQGESIRLRFNNCVTYWERTDNLGNVWLIPKGRNPLNPNSNYKIYRQRDNTLVLRV